MPLSTPTLKRWKQQGRVCLSTLSTGFMNSVRSAQSARLCHCEACCKTRPTEWHVCKSNHRIAAVERKRYPAGHFIRAYENKTKLFPILDLCSSERQQESWAFVPSFSPTRTWDLRDLSSKPVGIFPESTVWGLQVKGGNIWACRIPAQAQ